MSKKDFAPGVIDGPYPVKRELFWVVIGSVSVLCICAISVGLILGVI